MQVCDQLVKSKVCDQTGDVSMAEADGKCNARGYCRRVDGSGFVLVTCRWHTKEVSTASVRQMGCRGANVVPRA